MNSLAERRTSFARRAESLVERVRILNRIWEVLFQFGDYNACVSFDHLAHPLIAIANGPFPFTLQSQNITIDRRRISRRCSSTSSLWEHCVNDECSSRIESTSCSSSGSVYMGMTIFKSLTLLGCSTNAAFPPVKHQRYCWWLCRWLHVAWSTYTNWLAGKEERGRLGRLCLPSRWGARSLSNTTNLQ